MDMYSFELKDSHGDCVTIEVTEKEILFYYDLFTSLSFTTNQFSELIKKVMKVLKTLERN